MTPNDPATGRQAKLVSLAADELLPVATLARAWLTWSTVGQGGYVPAHRLATVATCCPPSGDGSYMPIHRLATVATMPVNRANSPAEQAQLAGEATTRQ